jgi:ferredoxin
MSTFIESHPTKARKCTVTFANEGKSVECDPGTNLYQLAKAHGISLFNGLAKAIHCRGLGCCGMCTVEVVPQAGVSRKRAREALRFWLLKGNLRMACQVTVEDDIAVTKHGGLKGKKGYRGATAREEVVRLYRDEGKTLAEVSAETGAPVPGIVNILEQAGVEMRKTGSAA